MAAPLQATQLDTAVYTFYWNLLIQLLLGC